LELSPQLVEALKRKNYDDIDPKSDVALGMRTRTIMDEVSNTPVPIMSEWPFKAEREAVIAHELAHLMLNHAQGHLKLNALMAFSACVFFFRPTLSILPLGIYGYSLHYFSRKWELEADRKACTMMGPEITQAMINRHRAKLSLEKMILGHYGLFDAPFRQVVLDRLFSFLFHVPLSVRIAYLSDILKEQRG
jgi:Zn-dependent protease with chaperone function